MRPLSSRIFVMFPLLLVLAATIASAQYNQPPSASPRDNKIKGEYIKTGLYYFAGEGNNSILRLSANGLVIVDGKLPGNYEGLIKRVHKISDQPVRFLILTSASESGTGTDAQFLQDGTRIIAQTNTAETVNQHKNTDGKSAPVTVTFDKTYDIKLGGVEVQTYHFGRAHSAGDAVVYFPNLKVVALGNLYSSNPDLDPGGSLVSWGDALGQVLKLDFDTAVPATGAPVTKAQVQAFQTKLEGMVTRARNLVQQGTPKDKLLAELRGVEPEWKLNLSPEQLNTFYAELSSREAASR